MAKKMWGYVIVTLDKNDDDSFQISNVFEAEGISPYKLVAGSYVEFMKIEDYDEIKNPQAIGDFIRWIGDKNTLSVKKLSDPVTDDLREVNQKKEAYSDVRLF